MFEYDKNTIERILKIEEFDLNKINLDNIKHVPMHQFRVTSNDIPLLLVENLQVCISLYAYSKNFAFAAHLNPVVIRGDEFEVDENKNIIYCNRINDLYKEIINYNPKDKIYIGLSIGCNPVYESYKLVELLDYLINELILKLNNKGIQANKLDLQYNHVFIIDSINENIIIPSVEKILTK